MTAYGALPGADVKIWHPMFGAFPDPPHKQAMLIDTKNEIAYFVNDFMQWQEIGTEPPIQSVFGRTGDVVAVANDYSSDLIDNDSLSYGTTVSDAINNLIAYTISITAGENLADRDYCYLNTSDSKWYKIDADSSTPLCGARRGFASGAISSLATGRMIVSGHVGGFTGLTANQPVYASTTAGALTQTKPSLSLGGSQVAIVRVGIATSSTYILMENNKVSYEKYLTLANDAEATIVHHADTEPCSRRIFGKLSTEIITAYGSDLTGGKSYLASNTDAGFSVADAFDNNNGTRWQTTNGTTSATVRVDLGTPAVIRKYTIEPSSSFLDRAPKDWTFEGSSDGSSWTTLDTRSGITSWAGSPSSFTFFNTNSYRYYRINATAANGGPRLAYAEVEMMEVSTSFYYGEQSAIITWNSSVAALKNRFLDGSAANPDTNTSFKNNYGASIDVICVVEL